MECSLCFMNDLTLFILTNGDGFVDTFCKNWLWKRLSPMTHGSVTAMVESTSSLVPTVLEKVFI